MLEPIFVAGLGCSLGVRFGFWPMAKLRAVSYGLARAPFAPRPLEVLNHFRCWKLPRCFFCWRGMFSVFFFCFWLLGFLDSWLLSFLALAFRILCIPSSTLAGGVLAFAACRWLLRLLVTLAFRILCFPSSSPGVLAFCTRPPSTF